MKRVIWKGKQYVNSQAYNFSSGDLTNEQAIKLQKSLLSDPLCWNICIVDA